MTSISLGPAPAPSATLLASTLAVAFALLVACAAPSRAEAVKILKPGPCDTPECRQFDFWVGDWNVYTPDGKLAGTNRVARILGGCVIEENWEGAKGTNGKSFNMYSGVDKKWHQTWVDSQGTRLDLVGGIEDGKMVMSGDTPSGAGGLLHNRITWEKVDGTNVRQHWEVSPDGDKWSDAFLGVYKPKDDAKGGAR